MEDHPPLTPLCELARHYGSDKAGWHLRAGDTCHNYGPAYHELFKDRRDQIRWVLEIGIAYGHSLRMWRDYFPSATIIGMDANRATLFNDERIYCFEGDQGRVEDLRRVATAPGPLHCFDLIVDDGSHEAAHQILSAQVLMPYLAWDGYYIIEDVFYDCHPERIGEPARINNNVKWSAIPTGHGIGRAHCECGCGEGEQLVVLRWI